MALIDYGATPRERELLYIINDKPVYRDEIRPIGESRTNIPWKELFYIACLVGGALATYYMEMTFPQ